MPKVRCVSYVDEFSAEKSCLRDLEIGLENQVVGCNSKTFGSSQKGDFVIICARHAGRLFVCIGEIDEAVKTSVWADQGGVRWQYNFRFTPLTKIVEVDKEKKERIKEMCDMYEVNPNMMFNMRFCGERYLPIIHWCIRDGIFE